MSTLPARLPAELAGRLAAASPGGGDGGGTGGGDTGGGGTGTGGTPRTSYSRQGREVDVAVAGIPFRLATTSDLPDTIETIPVRKDQLDVEQDPGEQSLSYWWRRSQASFHGGAGLLYQESSDTTAAETGYYDSAGVDVFTKGKVTLLKRMNGVDADEGAAYSRVRTCTLTTSEQIVTAVRDGALVKATLPANDNLTAPSVVHAPGSPIVDGLFVANGDYFDVDAGGTLYYPNATKSWPLGAPASRIMWGKGRLWAIGGAKIWQPDVGAATSTAQDPIYTNPNPGWTYTCMAEGPGAMYFGGHDGSHSSIQAITFDASGGIPTLSGAAVTAVLPDGELVQELVILAGTYFGIGTNRGFRVGQVDVYNNAIDYGPILFEPAGVAACTALAAQGRFFVVGFHTADESAVSYRIDTSVSLDNGLFPYARDVDCGTGQITSLATSPDGKRLVASQTAGGLYLQSVSKYVDGGYLQTGRIRFRTTESKQFKSLSYQAEPLQGVISVQAVLEGGGGVAVGTADIQGSTFDSSYAVNVTSRYMSFLFTFVPTEDLLGAPIFDSYLVKALPAVKPQRLITKSLMCFDHEQARSGQRYGGDGFASDRLSALQILEDAGETITYQDFSATLSAGRTVMIESLKFIQTAPAPPFKTKDGGAGGILQVQLRTVD